MKTPFGKECPYFFGDYHRGRHSEDCRLLNKPNQSRVWKSQYCADCPVPEVLQANACPHMVLSGEISNTFLGMKKNVKITAYCTKTHQAVKEPKIGCGQCHTLPEPLIRQ